MRLCLLLSLLLASATGCVGPRQLGAPPPAEQTPEAVNAALDGQRAAIELWSGERHAPALDVRLDADSLYFTSRSRRWEEQAVGMGEVLQISFVRDRKANKGALIGAIPGGALFVGGVAAEINGNKGVIFGRVFMLAGIGYVAIGSTVGALVGQWTAPGERVIVYQAPMRHGGADVETDRGGDG